MASTKLDSATQALLPTLEQKGLGRAKDLIQVALATVRGKDIDSLTPSDMPTEEEKPLVKKLLVAVVEKLLEPN